MRFSGTRITLTIFSSLGALLLIVSSLKFLFGWDWNLIFTATVLIAVGSYLIIESHIKNYKILKSLGGSFKKNFFASMNLLMFGIGALLIYIGLTTLPKLSALSITIPHFNGFVILGGGILALLNNFNWI